MAARRAANSKRRGLPKRQPTTSFYDVRIADDAEVEAAKRDLEYAQTYATLRFAKDETVRQAATAQLEQARARMSACFERITFREIDADVNDALLTKFPFPDEAEAKDLPAGYQWPCIHHLAAASAVDLDQSPEEWAAWTEGWSAANWHEFQAAVIAAQRRTATEGLPKG